MTLSNNIKTLRKEKGMSQSELAHMLEVSQTTITHYEKGVRQPTIDTLMNLSHIFNVSVDELLGHRAIGESDKKLDVKKIQAGHNQVINYEEEIHFVNQLLYDKNSDEFYDFVRTLSEKYPMEIIVDELLKPALYEVGLQWEKGQISEVDEHYATNLVRRAMGLFIDYKLPKIKKSKAITLATHGEKHTLGIEMVSAYLDSHGIQTLYLGSEVPTRSLGQMIMEYKPDYIFLSITREEHVNSLITLLHSIKPYSNDLTKVIIGGQGSGKVRTLLGTEQAITFIDTMNQLIDFLNTDNHN
jgi:transcriptional regulator with XRE-family HTH domain